MVLLYIVFVQYYLPGLFQLKGIEMLRKMINASFICVAFGSFSSCSKVPAGSVGIKVYLLGGSKGVDLYELRGS